MSRLAPGPFHLSIQWVPGFFPDVKWQGCDLDDACPSVANVKKEWSCNYVRLCALIASTWTNLHFYDTKVRITN